MTSYAEQRQAKRHPGGRPRRKRQPPDAKEQLVGALKELRGQRRRQRWDRRTSDTVWREARAAQAARGKAWRALSKAAQQPLFSVHEAEQVQWQARRASRRAEQAQREVENAQWHETRQALINQAVQLTPGTTTVSVWLAILVVIDNCTRRCVGLPLFGSGPHVTCEEVVNALRPLLPPGLAFLISDNGQQFRAAPFSALAGSAHFLHVRIAPYRPCSNGIAERFVQTLKGLLVGHTWQDAQQLADLLPDCQAVYNDRPHQSPDLDGRSPNEYARVLTKPASC